MLVARLEVLSNDVGHAQFKAGATEFAAFNHHHGAAVSFCGRAHEREPQTCTALGPAAS